MKTEIETVQSKNKSFSSAATFIFFTFEWPPSLTSGTPRAAPIKWLVMVGALTANYSVSIKIHHCRVISEDQMTIMPSVMRCLMAAQAAKLTLISSSQRKQTNL